LEGAVSLVRNLHNWTFGHYLFQLLVKIASNTLCKVNGALNRILIRIEVVESSHSTESFENLFDSQQKLIDSESVKKFIYGDISQDLAIVLGSLMLWTNICVISERKDHPTVHC